MQMAKKHENNEKKKVYSKDKKWISERENFNLYDNKNCDTFDLLQNMNP